MKVCQYCKEEVKFEPQNGRGWVHLDGSWYKQSCPTCGWYGGRQGSYQSCPECGEAGLRDDHCISPIEK